MTANNLPDDIALMPVDQIHPSPLQPRNSVSMDLVRKLAESMRAGRHLPILEVEPDQQDPVKYQIVCGEQRWRAAKEAGLERVLVRIHRQLDYLTRLQKQYEENRLRADLSPFEDAQLVLTVKTLRDIAAAERLLQDGAVAFTPLADRRVTSAASLTEHLESLKKLLLEHRLHVLKTGDGPVVAPLSPWRETEHALGISDATRKAKLSVLRLEPEVRAETNALPARHAPLIARIEGRQRRVELVERAPQLTHRQLLATVRRLRADPDLNVEDAVAGKAPAPDTDPLAFENQLAGLADLCRQLARLLANLRPRVTAEEREHVCGVLAGLIKIAHTFGEAA